MKKIWQRYLLRQIGTTFLFILICLFVVFILLDFSIHGVRFLKRGATDGIDIFIYYFRLFAMHLELFLPLTFLLTTLKVLFDLNHHFELVALQMAGLSRKTLLRPFFLFAALLSLVCYINSQWFAPDAILSAQTFKTLHSKTKKRAPRSPLQSIALPDDSELVYQSFDAEKQELFDVFWVRSSEDIWHMKFLRIDISPPQGHFIDHLIRKERLEKSESFDARPFPELPMNPDTKPKAFIPFESRSLTTLLHEAIYASSNKASVRTHLQYKLALPLLSLLGLLAIAPLTMRFSRDRPTLLIVALSLFGFLALKTLFDSLLILGENQVLPSWVAMWLPLLALFAYSIKRFAKL